jgi:hypothetical protein
MSRSAGRNIHGFAPRILLLIWCRFGIVCRLEVKSPEIVEWSERTRHDGAAVAQRVDHGSAALLAMFLWICGPIQPSAAILIQFHQPDYAVFVVISPCC